MVIDRSTDIWREQLWIGGSGCEYWTKNNITEFYDVIVKIKIKKILRIYRRRISIFLNAHVIGRFFLITNIIYVSEHTYKYTIIF